MADKQFFSNELSINNVVLGTSRFGCYKTDDGIFHSDPKNLERDSQFLRLCIDSGIHYIDTARAYGLSEAVVGNAVSQFSRSSIFVSTKVGMGKSSPDSMRLEIYKSCSELGFEPDLLFLHNRNDAYTLGDIKCLVKTLDWAIDNGLAKFIGISNFRTNEFLNAINFSKRGINFYQGKVNLVESRSDFKEIYRICTDYNIKFMASSALNKGRVIFGKEIANLCEKYSMSFEQFSVKALSIAGFIPIFQSHNIDHVRDIVNTIDFNIDKKDHTAFIKHVFSTPTVKI